MNNIITIVAPNNFKIEISIIEKILKILNLTEQSLHVLKASKAYDFRNVELTKDKESLLLNFLKDYPIDCFFLNEQYRAKKKLLLSDMDATLIQNECIDEIARHIGKYEEISKITEQAMNGNMLFEGSLEQRVRLLEGVSKEDLELIYNRDIKVSEGVVETAKFLKSQSVHLVIVSGGFTYFCNRLAEDISFDEFYANELIFTHNKLTGHIKKPVFSSESKAEVLALLMQKMGVKKDEVIAIGDGANDIPFLNMVPFSIGFKAKPIIQKKVRFNIVHSDYSAIIYILGNKFD